MTARIENKEPGAGDFSRPLVISGGPPAKSVSDLEPATDRRGIIQQPPPDPDEPARPRCGALVLEVELGGAGDQKGLREGDIIVEFEGQAVRSALELAGWIRREGEGSLVSIHIWRDGRKSWLGNARLSGRAPRVVVEDELAALRDGVVALRDGVAASRDDIARFR